MRATRNARNLAEHRHVESVCSVRDVVDRPVEVFAADAAPTPRPMPSATPSSMSRSAFGDSGSRGSVGRVEHLELLAAATALEVLGELRGLQLRR